MTGAPGHTVRGRGFMSLEKNATMLARLPFFRAFADQQIRLIAFGSDTVQLQRGDTLFRMGEQADSAFLVVEGTIELSSDRTGMRLTRDIVRSGSLIGPLTLLCAGERPLHAQAMTASTVLRIRRDMVRRVLAEYPDAARRLYTTMSEDLNRFMGDLNRAERLLRAA